MQKQTYETVSELYRKYVMKTCNPHMVLVRGKGTYVWDINGRRFLDFGSGISVCNLGHCNKAVAAAIKEQVDKLVHTSNLYMNLNQPRLAKALADHGFDGISFFCNSGAEANEGMIKFARKWGHDQGKYEIITMADSFHGRTLATLAATGRAKYRKGFEPDMPGFVSVPFNDLKALQQAVGEKTAAVMMEPVQGEGGIIPADPEYIRAVRQLCNEKGILLLFDEVQCGMGRTGKFFAFQNFDVEPDALSMAKAMANGYPMGAFMVKRQYGDVLQVGSHNSTFGGTPLASAAALAVIDYMDEKKVLKNCGKQSRYLLRALTEMKEKYRFITDVRGLGLMIGVVLDRPAGELLPKLEEHGLLALSAGESVLRLLPPLTVSRKEINKALAIMTEVFDQV
ncbi:MAG: aspartate aminotransferase family protein [Victivallales bacterium]|nr:aspartate aminotransferase family protein [Victivallales bacterium]